MASISKNVYGELLIDGLLTQDDIAFLNQIESNVNVVLKNTKGLSSEILKKITNKKIIFSIVGGLEKSKTKYNDEIYKKRTYHSKEELIKIIEYFENVEKGLLDEMSEMEKCMYIYCCIIQDTNYVTKYRDADINSDLIENSLTGNLYHKLTCAGIALTYKELLDRQGIKCEYLNKKSCHSFNRIEIDGKKYGIDLTWDLNHYERENIYAFNYFGRQDSKHFYIKYHDLSSEPDETMDELDTFTDKEIMNCFNSIKSLLSNRKKHIPAVDEMSREEKISTLKIHHNYNELQREASFLGLINYLKKKKVIKSDDYRCAFANKRCPIVFDVVGRYVTALEDVDGIDGNYQLNFDLSDEFNVLALKAIDDYMQFYIRDFFEMSAIYASSIKYISFEENEELYIYYCLLKNKIEYFNSIKSVVTKMGYGEELDYFNYALNREEVKRKKEVSDKRENYSQYDNDYDYLSCILSADEMLYIKDYIEKTKGKTISIDEFKKLFTNPSFMRKIFKEQWKFTDEELRKLLNEVYNKNVAIMIELINQRNSANTKLKKIDEIVNNDINNDFDDSVLSDFDEEFTGKFI